MTQAVESRASLNEIVNKMHALWNAIERTDDPQTRKLHFGQIAEIEKQIVTHQNKETNMYD
jgi:hypothetical protein